MEPQGNQRQRLGGAVSPLRPTDKYRQNGSPGEPRLKINEKFNAVLLRVYMNLSGQRNSPGRESSHSSKIKKDKVDVTCNI